MRSLLDIYEAWDKNNTGYIDDLEEGLSKETLQRVRVSETGEQDERRAMKRSARIIPDTFFSLFPLSPFIFIREILVSSI